MSVRSHENGIKLLRYSGVEADGGLYPGVIKHRYSASADSAERVGRGNYYTGYMLVNQ